jgi:hypothetical protein
MRGFRALFQAALRLALPGRGPKTKTKAFMATTQTPATETETKSPADLLNENLETFLGKFKSITPDQQIALNNLRDSIDAVKSGANDKDKTAADKDKTGKTESAGTTAHTGHASKPSSSY